MEELYYGSVIVWYGYTVGVSQCDSVELLKCDSVEELFCASVRVWYSYTVEVSECDSVELWKCDSVV